MNNPCNCGNIYTHITISLSIYSIFPSPQKVLKCPFSANLHTQKKLLWFALLQISFTCCSSSYTVFSYVSISFLQQNVFEIHSCFFIYQYLVPFYCFFFFYEQMILSGINFNLIYFYNFYWTVIALKSCVTFLLYNEVNQLYMYIYPLLLGPLCSSPQPIRLIQVIKEYQAELPVLYSRFQPAIYFTLSSVCMFLLLSSKV